MTRRPSGLLLACHFDFLRPLDQEVGLEERAVVEGNASLEAWPEARAA